MYSVIWQYKVEEKNQVRFELEYGKKGSWARLFSNSKNYLGSHLYRNEEIDTYLLIDNWTEKKSYKGFIETNKDVYEDMSIEFEKLYNKEEKIGEFELM